MTKTQVALICESIKDEEVLNIIIEASVYQAVHFSLLEFVSSIASEEKVFHVIEEYKDLIVGIAENIELIISSGLIKTREEYAEKIKRG